METIKDFVFKGNKIIAAHRGASGIAPENTIAAFKLALEQGANMIETDLQFTSDGHIVAFHDLEHLKNNSSFNDGQPSLSDIKQIDAGAWFNEKFTGEKIPTFNEILDFAKNRTYVNFEIKEFNSNFNKEIIAKMVHSVIKHKLEKYIMFASFNYPLIKFIKEINSNIHTAGIKIPGKNQKPSEIAYYTGCEAFICSADELNDELNINCIDNNLFIGTYSIDSEKDFLKIKDYDVTAFGTNYPEKIKKILLKHKYIRI